MSCIRYPGTPCHFRCGPFCRLAGYTKDRGGRVPPWLYGFVGEFWDGDSGVTIATGVSAWTGVKQGLVLAQGTANAQPAYSNGVLTGDGSNDALSMTGLWSGNASFFIFVAAKKLNNNLNVLAFAGVDSGTPTAYYMGYNPGSASPEVVRTAFASGNGQLDSSANYVQQDWHIYGMSYAGATGSHKLYVDGAISSNAYASANLTLGTFKIFQAGATSYNNSIKGLGIGSQALSDAQMHQIGRAMGMRYGVSVL